MLVQRYNVKEEEKEEEETKEIKEIELERVCTWDLNMFFPATWPTPISKSFLLRLPLIISLELLTTYIWTFYNDERFYTWWSPNQIEILTG